MHDEPRQKTALGDMPRPKMDAPPKATSMPTGSMIAAGYQRSERSALPREASSVGGRVRNLYDEMFGLTGPSETLTRSGAMPSPGTGKTMREMPSGPMHGSTMQGSAMPGAVIGAQQGTAQSTIEITGRWKLTLTPTP